MTTLSGDGPAGGHGRGPHARPRGVPRGHARLALPPAHAGTARAPRGRRRSHRLHPRGRRALRRALREPRRTAQPQRGPQHRCARGTCAADRVRRRRHPGAGGLARGGARRRRATPQGGGARRPHPGALRGPRAACLRARGPADHDARPGRARPRGRDGLGCQLRRAALGDRAHRRVRRVDPRAARRRGGVARAAARGGRHDRVHRGRRTRPPAHGGGRPPRPAGARRLRARPRRPGKRHPPRTAPRASAASCACSRAAAGTRSAAPARRA